MKKLSTLLLTGVVAFGFAACNQEKGGNTPATEGKTNAKLVFSENLRAVTDGQDNAEGTTEESKVAQALFFAAGNTFDKTLTNVAGFTATGAEESKAYESPVFEYTGTMGAGIQSALIVNYTGLTANDQKADLTVGIDKLSTLAKDAGFTMSSKSNEAIEIKENVKAEEVAADNNLFPYTVERVVSKVQVQKATDVTINNITKGPRDANAGVAKYEGTFANYRYALAGSAKNLYLFADKAGDRTVDPTSQKYNNYESAIHGLAASTFKTVADQKVFDVRRDVQKVSDLSLVTLFPTEASADVNFTKLNSLPLAEGETNFKASNSDKNGIYFLENSCNNAADYSDIAQVKVYANFSPSANLWKAKADKKGVEAATFDDIKNDRDVTVDVTKEWVNSLTSEDKTRIGADLTGDETTGYKLTMHIKAGTFFLGKTTLKLYTDPEAARLDNETTTFVYVAGKMLWQTPANGQIKDKKYIQTDTRRNNIYSLLVNEILGLGDNYDPQDPTDPNAPKPDPEDNPDEPKKPEDHPINKDKTNIKVQAKILKWNLVYRTTGLISE